MVSMGGSPLDGMPCGLVFVPPEFVEMAELGKGTSTRHNLPDSTNDTPIGAKELSIFQRREIGWRTHC